MRRLVLAIAMCCARVATADDEMRDTEPAERWVAAAQRGKADAIDAVVASKRCKTLARVRASDVAAQRKLQQCVHDLTRRADEELVWMQFYKVGGTALTKAETSRLALRDGDEQLVGSLRYADTIVTIVVAVDPHGRVHQMWVSELDLSFVQK